jgi:peptidoglycan/xylan/chitin deacetylase (PgdA/CDA1 family)
LPELARRGWPATVFITTSYLDRRPYLLPEEIPRILEMGISVGNHTHSHRDLTGLPDAEIAGELHECARRLRDLTGAVPSHFCYPNGRYNPRVRSAVAREGVLGACTGRVGQNPPGSDPLVLRRLTSEWGDGPRELRWRLAGGYDFLDRRQRHMDRD